VHTRVEIKQGSETSLHVYVACVSTLTTGLIVAVFFCRTEPKLLLLTYSMFSLFTPMAAAAVTVVSCVGSFCSEPNSCPKDY